MVSEKSPVVELDPNLNWPVLECRAKEAYFRALLKSRRWRRGDTEVAEAAGVSPPTIASWYLLFGMERPYKQRR